MKTRTLFDALNTLDDLDDLIASGQRESETLEYKEAGTRLSGDALNEVSKDVSALANSLGGLIIYGVRTDKAQPGLPIGRVSIDPKNIGIIQRSIASGIRHPVTGIRYKELPPLGAPEAFLVDVPQSPLAPHQSVVRHIYYRRNGPHSDPMSHDLIELYFGRRLGPILEPRLRLRLPNPGVEKKGKVGNYQVDVAVQNKGQRAAKNGLVMIYVPTAAFEIIDCPPPGGKHLLSVDGPFTKMGVSLASSVFHAGLDADVYSFSCRIDLESATNGKALISVAVHAEEMSRQTIYGVVHKPPSGETLELRALPESEWPEGDLESWLRDEA